jgi:aspartokinase
MFISMNKQHTVARERFCINSIQKDSRAGITVMANYLASPMASLLADQFGSRMLSIDMFVLHSKGKSVTASIVLDKCGDHELKHLNDIAVEIKNAVGRDISILIHDAVTKLTIQGHGLCTSPRTSREIFEKIRKTGQNIEMMSISENEINLVFNPSPELERFLDSFLAKHLTMSGHDR